MELTKQDLIFAARALRVAAGVDDEKAKEPRFFSSREIFQRSAQSQRELAAKFERVAAACGADAASVPPAAHEARRRPS